MDILISNSGAEPQISREIGQYHGCFFRPQQPAAIVLTVYNTRAFGFQKESIERRERKDREDKNILLFFRNDSAVEGLTAYPNSNSNSIYPRYSAAIFSSKYSKHNRRPRARPRGRGTRCCMCIQ